MLEYKESPASESVAIIVDETVFERMVSVLSRKHTKEGRFIASQDTAKFLKALAIKSLGHQDNGDVGLKFHGVPITTREDGHFINGA